MIYRALTTAALLVATAALADSPPALSTDVEHIIDFAKLTPREAARLTGRRHLIQIELGPIVKPVPTKGSCFPLAGALTRTSFAGPCSLAP
jgi:hypothetical protein